MSGASSQEDSAQSETRLISPINIALICTLAVYALHKSKKVKTEAAKLREKLWGLKFQPLTAQRQALLLVLGIAGLLALVGHTMFLLGPGATVLVVGLLGITFRNAGLLRLPLQLRLSLGGVSADKGGESAASRPPLPVWVITGFLGSGKTTLVNRLVRAVGEGATVTRLLVVENEVGDTTLDAELVIQASGTPENVLLVNDGCACCKVRGDLCDLLRDEVLGRRAMQGEIDGVIIECSGLADPKAVVQTFLLDDDLRSRLELREVVAVVDAMNVERYLCPDAAISSGSRCPPLARLVEEQIAFASLVLLNKADSVRGHTMLEDLVHRIRAVNDTAEVLECIYCNIDVARILGGSGFQHTPGAWSADRALLDIERIHITIGDSMGKGIQEPTPGTESAVRCISVRVEGELDLDYFNRWVLRTLSNFDILRAKGVLAAKGYPEKLAFQAVHAAFDGTPSLSSRWQPGEPRFSQIVVIGCDLQADLIEFGLKHCLADGNRRRASRT